MIRKSRHTSRPLNGGVITYGYTRTIRDSLGKVAGEDFISLGPPLAFEYMNMRQDDFDYFEGRLQADVKKLRTYQIPETTKSKRVMLNGMLYDITKSDTDGTYRYWYLERVKDET